MKKYVEMNPDEIFNEMKESVQALTEEELHEGDERCLFMRGLSAYFVSVFSRVNFLKNQNFINDAEGEYLDYLGENFYNTERLKATHSICKCEIELTEIRPDDTLFEKGSKASAGEINGDTEKIFIFDDDFIIPAGETKAIFNVTAENAGEEYNDIGIGKINFMITPAPYVKSIKNIEVTSQGSNDESDEKYRERCKISLSKLSVAGPEMAYKYLALSAHNSIKSVEIDSSLPGTVQIYALLDNGVIPGEEIKNNILKSCNGKYTRPDTDNVTVEDPEEIEYNIELTYYIDSNFKDMCETWRKSIEGKKFKDDVNDFSSGAIHDFVAFQREILGRDILKDELIYKIQDAATYTVKTGDEERKLTGIRAIDIVSPTDTKLNINQVAKCTGINVTFGGFK